MSGPLSDSLRHGIDDLIHASAPAGRSDSLLHIFSEPRRRYHCAVPSVHWEPAPSLIERYSPPAIRAVWADQHRFELFLRIEILACEASARIGRIPEAALPKIRQASFDVDRIAEVEARVGHDVVAFLSVVNESIGQPEARYVHLGMTSQDLNDNAMAVQLVESSRIIAR